MAIRAIIVDFYDVLYGEKDPTQLRTFEESCGLSAGGLRRAMSRSKYFCDARLGQVSGEVLWRDVAAHIGADPQTWQTIVSLYDSAFGLNEELVYFLQTLQSRYKIALLSNATPQVRRIITQRFHLEHLFDAIVISAEEGVKKPEPESYQRTLQMLQVAAQEAIFVDDDQTYVSAAQALGMYGIAFHSTQQAITDIRRLLEPGERISSSRPIEQ